MKFNFPSNTKKESVTINLPVLITEKVRTLAQKHDCAITEIYITLVTEAIAEYEGLNGEIEGVEGKKVFSHKRDVFKAGDGLRKRNTDPLAEKSESLQLLKCANMKCPWPSDEYQQQNMTEYDGKFFCSIDCAQAVRGKVRADEAEDSTRDFIPPWVSKIVPPWHPKYDSCVKCHSKKKKHVAKGLCTTCYFKQK